MIRVAIDTSALLALANPRDQYHRRATEAMALARDEGVTWLSTMLVLAELHGHLIRYLTPSRAAEIIRALAADETFDWVTSLMRTCAGRSIPGSHASATIRFR